MNKKTTINIVLGLLCVVLFYANYKLINDTLKETARLKEIKVARVAQLEHIKTCQMDFLEKHGRFTANWDSLKNFMQHGKLYKLKQIGDPDKNPGVKVRFDTTFYNPLETDLPKDFDISTLENIPFTKGSKFKLEAGHTTKNEVLVPTFQATDLEKIGKDQILQMGNLYDVKRSGNWK